MADFQVGNVVRRIGGGFNNMKTGDTATVIAVHKGRDRPSLSLEGFGIGHDSDYFELVAVFNLKEGKRYKTRNGRIWRAICYDPDNPKLMICRTDTRAYVSRWRDGRYRTDKESATDLVEELKPERWVGLHYYGTHVGIISQHIFSSQREVEDWYKSKGGEAQFIKAVRIE